MTRLYYAPLFLAIGGALHPDPLPRQSLNDLLMAISHHWIEAQRVETLRATLADMDAQRAHRPPGPVNHAGYVLDPNTATAEDVQAALGFRPGKAPADMLDPAERSETELSSTPDRRTALPDRRTVICPCNYCPDKSFSGNDIERPNPIN